MFSVCAAVAPWFASLLFQFVGRRLACSINLLKHRAGKSREKPHEITRTAPILKRPAGERSARARPHAIHHTGNLDAQRCSRHTCFLLLRILCSVSSRRSCFSSRVFRRLQCLRLSRSTRFPFHDSQVYSHAKIVLRGAQERPIGAKSAPRGAKRGPREPQEPPRGSKRPPEIILERDWSHFGPPGT